jgi:hypothetical protein
VFIIFVGVRSVHVSGRINLFMLVFSPGSLIHFIAPAAEPKIEEREQLYGQLMA